MLLYLAVLALMLALVPPVQVHANPAPTPPTVRQIGLPDGFDTDGGPLKSGVAVTGNVFPKGNVDEFTIAGRANQWITIEIIGTLGLRPQVLVLYPNGKLFTDAHGEQMAKKSVQLMTTGTYTVQVKSYPYPSETTGPYTLKVTIGDSRP
ncbi:MAG: hypothetical protein U0893_11160 [Chloroflexota bacterium]